MTKSDLIKKMHWSNQHLPFETVDAIVRTIIDQITLNLSHHGRIEIRGFGSFEVIDRKPRLGRNPRSGEPVQVPAKKLPYFKPGKELRARVNESHAPINKESKE